MNMENVDMIKNVDIYMMICSILTNQRYIGIVAYSSIRGVNPKITHQFYTSDFYYFGEKSENDLYVDVGTIKHFDKRDRRVGFTLKDKKKDFYILLRKYMLIKEIDILPELIEIINHKINFVNLLITVKYTHNTDWRVIYDTSYPY